MRRSSKLGVALIAVHFALWAFVALTSPEYDGHDVGALIFWIVLSHGLLIIGGVFLIIDLLRWFVNRADNGI